MNRARVSVILLAAGESRRMGSPKALLPFGTSTIIESIVDKLLALPFSEVIVVLGHEADALLTLITSRAVTMVINHDYRRGMLSSVQQGIQSVSSVSEGAMICLLDQPHIPASVFSILLESFTGRSEDIVVPMYENRRGHPVIIPARFFDEVMRLVGNEGLKELLRRHPQAIREIQVEFPEILRDIDDPNDYNRETAKMRED